MKLAPVISATMPDGAMRSWHCGSADTIRQSEGAIRTALAEARAAAGVDLRIAFVDQATGQCRYRVRVKQEVARP